MQDKHQDYFVMRTFKRDRSNFDAVFIVDPVPPDLRKTYLQFAYKVLCVWLYVIQRMVQAIHYTLYTIHYTLYTIH
jgi:hypothetical protein